MKAHYKPLLIAGLLALPMAAVQAQSAKSPQTQVPDASASQVTGEGAGGAIPADSATPPTPSMTQPPATEKSTGEGEESGKPGTDQPLTTSKPAPVDSTSANIAQRPSTETGHAQQTAPSVEQPPRAAPMRTGPDSTSSEGSNTIQGSTSSK